MLILRFLGVVLMTTMLGCATADRTPPRQIPESTWRQVDNDIVAASQAAKEQAQRSALSYMNDWMDLVYQRTDSAFIPWFTSYWTQQWLTLKVAWYKMSAEGELDPTVDRLTLYLQEQYQGRVLRPVSREIDPDLIMRRTTQIYVEVLGERLRRIPPRHGVPLPQFDQRLQGIPAIALAPPEEHNASLYQLLHAKPLDRLPAYVALIDRVRTAAGGTGARSLDPDISAVAKRTSERLVTELATSGAASAASMMVGRVAGMMISLGVSGFTAMARANDRQELAAQLRQHLNADFDDAWLDLMRNPDSGVLAGAHYLSEQIQGSLAGGSAAPLRFEPPPRVPDPLGEPSRRDGIRADVVPTPPP
ncbi:hypothetical protein [Zestomonas carbonaria]|nr:hypothetical protein [Pseudomonas carbonaria]